MNGRAKALSGALAVCVALVSAPVRGAQDPGAEDPAVGEVQRLFQQADSEYQTSNYQRSVDTFTEAFTRSGDIEDPELRENVRTSILFNLARAHIKAYDVDQQASHLRTAKDLLTKYIETDPGDRAEAEQLLAQADTELAGLSDDDEPEPAAPEPATPTPGSTQPAAPVDEEAKGGASGMTIAGYVTTALVVPALGLLTAGAVIADRAEEDFHAGPTLAERKNAESRGKTGDSLILVGAVSAGVLAAAGITLIAIGKVRERKQIAALPIAGPGFAGVSIGGRF